MTDMRDDLRELGRRLWPDDSALRPRATARPRRWVGVAVTVASASLMVGALSIAVARHDRGPAPGAASSPHGRGSGAVVALHMADSSVGWAWGPTLVTHTTDGVATLMDVTPAGVDTAHRVTAADFLDAEHAWVVAGPASGPGNSALYRTDDGGGHWSRFALDFNPGGLTFIDEQHGWLETGAVAADHVTNNIVLMRTTDGGATWSTVYRTAQRQTIQPNGPKGDCQWLAPVFATTQLGFEGLSCDDGGGPRLDVTRDGGSTWQRVQLPPVQDPVAGTLMSISVTPLRFVSAPEGVVAVDECIGEGMSCSFHTVLYRTADGGLSWTAAGATVATSGAVVAADPDHAWVPAGVGQLLATGDGGRTWITLPTRPELEPSRANTVSYQFLSPGLGYAVSVVGRSGPTVTHLYRTTDAGAHFLELTPTMESGSAPDLPAGGLSIAKAIAAAQRVGGPLASGSVSVASIAAGRVRDVAPQAGSSMLPPSRWVWSVVLRGSFDIASFCPLPVNGTPAACPRFPPSTSARVILDYFSGGFLSASVPAPTDAPAPG